MTLSRTAVAAALLFCADLPSAKAFVARPTHFLLRRPCFVFCQKSLTTTQLSLALDNNDGASAVTPPPPPQQQLDCSDNSDLLSYSLSKPLGLILEDETTQEGQGVYIQQVTDSGSAAAYADQLQGCTLVSVQNQDVTSLSLEKVMEMIQKAPDTVDLQVQHRRHQLSVAAEPTASNTDEVIEAAVASFDIGTPVTITFQQPGSADVIIAAKVGDNLRTTLLEHNVEVYQGLKQKLGNCGGAGQCTFCAMDVLQSEGWLERSEYEDKKLAKFPSARLACLNNIQGPAVLQKTQR